MGALALLAAAVFVARFADAWQVARVAALLLALTAGLTLPDIDQVLPLLDHRDALTHSALPALLVLRWRPVAAGLALGLALHLAADCFPESMRGFATVKLPFFDSLGGWSYAWLGVNTLAGAVLFGVAFRRTALYFIAYLATLAAALIIGGGYLLRVDGGWWALASIMLIGWGTAKVAAR